MRIVARMKIRLGNLRLSVLALCLLLLSVTSAGFTNIGHSSTSIFKINLMVPDSNPARQSWSLVVQSQLQSLGIDAQRIIVPFNPSIIARAIVPNPPSLAGKTYDQGGWDTLFIGNALGIDADPAILYNSTNFAPTGQNYNLWNNTQADKLGTLIERTVDKTQRLNYVKQWQALAQDEAPSATILYTREIVAFDNAKIPNGGKVFTTYHYPYWPPIEQLSSSPADGSLILAQTGNAPFDLIPELSQSYYDSTIFGVIYGTIAQRNDTVVKSMVPMLATGTPQAPGWSVGPDGKTWTVTLRPGVTWHDGVPFNATDVKFTFDSIQADALASPQGSFYKTTIGGPNSVTVVDPYTVKFALPNVYSYFVENILGGTAILPKHILGNIALGSWKTSDFNTGKGVAGTGPVGLGPYKYVVYDSTTSTTHLTRNDAYLDFPSNGKTALTARGAFQVKDYYVRYILGSDVAISSIKTGAVQVLDSQYHLETQQTFLSDWGSNRLAIYDAFGIQEMAFMMKHPILGTGVDTPLGKQDPTKAALAAKYVRQAISHAIPRQLIIDELLHGYGKPGITSAVTSATDGYDANLAPHDFNLTKSRQLLQAAGYFPPGPAAAPSFWDAYGLYLVAGLIVAIVALAAVFVLRARRPTAVGRVTTTTTSPSPPTT